MACQPMPMVSRFGMWRHQWCAIHDVTLVGCFVLT